MGIETTITKVVDACNKLTDTVTSQIGKINTRMDTAQEQFSTWRGTVQAKDINGRASYSQVIDLTGLSTNIFYPVWWRMPGNEQGISEIVISRNYAQNHELNPFNNNFEPHVAGLNLQMEGCGIPWNGDANFLAIKRVSQTYRETVRKAQFAMLSFVRPVTGLKPIWLNLTPGVLTTSPQESGCYLRGGLTYLVTKSFQEPVKYSRTDEEVELSQAVTPEYEISWKVKPFVMTAPELGDTYPESNTAYTLDNDKRYAVKGA
ncbi:phage tail protein [Pseudomonas lactis]|uniref:phage tail protein n=1 Tax=Pseudomonas TaxID=286 RepID=UPI000BB5F492|nr:MULTISPECIES: phage tail protein [Pseudomonas]MBA5956010.1 phage tail protein [Pseudomonas lactis]PRW77176.1 phage tail protein [Pseudomonas fluorescens]PRW79258.1 phage tail protein [Pseudomonas fluorescens]